MYVTRKKSVAAILIATGFVIILFSISLCGDNLIMSSMIGIITFFTISCFLPETKPSKFLSRGSSLTLVGYFTYLALKEVIKNEEGGYTIGNYTIPILLPMFLGVLAYWLSIFIIRGFHGEAEYAGFNTSIKVEEQAGEINENRS